MSLQKEERDHLVIGLALRRLCRRTVIAPRSASMQILFLKAVFVFLVSGRRRHRGGAGGDTRFVVRAVFPEAYYGVIGIDYIQRLGYDSWHGQN